jgi:hypothetical protein
MGVRPSLSNSGSFAANTELISEPLGLGESLLHEVAFQHCDNSLELGYVRTSR